MDKAKIKPGIVAVLIAISIMVSILAIAKPDTSRVPATNTKSGNIVIIPKHAVEVADGVFDLGTGVDIDGREVQGYLLFAKPGTECGNGVCEKGENANKCPADCSSDGGSDTTSSCFTVMSKGAKWKTVEPWVVNPSNSRGLDETFVLNNLKESIQQWEDAVAGADILGNGASTSDSLVADTQNPDGVNEVYFADVSSSGAIAVTIVWGIFRGPPSGRELVEWDQVYDDVDYDWSEDCTIDNCTAKMDFWNIAEHELGHSLGLTHPSETCTEETMYAFAGFGEIKKRDLNDGDVVGVNELYG
jgi:hypothetical protein